MNPKTYFTAGVIALSWALPASASAATTSASASVRADAKASVQAFEKVKVLTEDGRDAAAAAKLRLGLRELRSAARTTARMQRKADGNRALLRVVQAHKRVGRSADIGANVLADVVADADVSGQVKMAAALSSLLRIHQQAVAALAATVKVASDTVDTVAVAAIAALTASAGGIVNAISDTIASANASVNATANLNMALQLATATVSTSLAILQTIAATATATVQGTISAAIAQVTSALVQTQATLQALVGTVASISTNAVGSIVLPTLSSLLGSLSVALSANAQPQLGPEAAASAG